MEVCYREGWGGLSIAIDGGTTMIGPKSLIKSIGALFEMDI